MNFAFVHQGGCFLIAYYIAVWPSPSTVVVPLHTGGRRIPMRALRPSTSSLDTVLASSRGHNANEPQLETEWRSGTSEACGRHTFTILHANGRRPATTDVGGTKHARGACTVRVVQSTVSNPRVSISFLSCAVTIVDNIVVLKHILRVVGSIATSFTLAIHLSCKPCLYLLC